MRWFRAAHRFNPAWKIDKKLASPRVRSMVKKAQARARRDRHRQGRRGSRRREGLDRRRRVAPRGREGRARRRHAPRHDHGARPQAVRRARRHRQDETLQDPDRARQGDDARSRRSPRRRERRRADRQGPPQARARAREAHRSDQHPVRRGRRRGSRHRAPLRRRCQEGRQAGRRSTARRRPPRSPARSGRRSIPRTSSTPQHIVFTRAGPSSKPHWYSHWYVWAARRSCSAASVGTYEYMTRRTDRGAGVLR